MREMGRGVSDHSDVICKVKLEAIRIRTKGKISGPGRIKDENLREQYYKEGTY